MKILDGKALSQKIKESLVFEGNQKPTLAIIQVGDNPASNIYIKRKMKMAESLGVETKLFKFNNNESQQEVLEKIKSLNSDSEITGIIIQLPLPENFDFNKLISAISPKKDVDGLGSQNIYNLVCNKETILPATARGVITLLQENEIEISGKKIAVIGRSLLVGKSLALALTNRNATVILCHSKTNNLSEITKSADILISAVGNPDLVSDEYTNPNQVVIDVGITISEGVMKGDVFSQNMAYKSPVPGGVGPMTVISLFQNLLDSYNLQKNNRDI